MSLLLPVHLLTGELQRKLLGTLPGRHAVRNMLVRTGFHGAEQRGLIQREVVQRTLQSRIQRRPNNTHLPLASFVGDPIFPPDSFATACARSAPTSLISALRKSTASRRSARAALVASRPHDFTGRGFSGGLEPFSPQTHTGIAPGASRWTNLQTGASSSNSQLAGTSSGASSQSRSFRSAQRSAPSYSHASCRVSGNTYRFQTRTLGKWPISAAKNAAA